MTADRRLRFWLAGLLLAGLVIWLLRGALMPFVAGAAIAYLLDPVVERLARHKVPRWLATTLVLLSFLVVIVVALVLLVPVVATQLGGLVAAVPGYLGTLNAWLNAVIERLQERFGVAAVQNLRGQLAEYAGDAVSWLGTLLGGLWRGGLAVIDILSLLVITPVVAFYLLRDWDRVLSTLDDYIPRPQRATVRDLARQVDRTLADFVRGQGLVCLSLGLFYSAGLTMAGLNFGLVVGLGAGLISFIPYVGTILGLVTSCGIALVQFDSWTMRLVILGIFVTGQVLEGYVLVPKLVGESIGLHPVWVMFALLAGGSLFGFTGVLLAVPVAAVAGVLVRFALGRYRSSPYFRGGMILDPAAAASAPASVPAPASAVVTPRPSPDPP